MDGSVSPPPLGSSGGPKNTTQALRLAGLGVAGIWLVGLITISVILAIIIFSASQFQSRIATLTMNGSALTIWKAEPLREQWLGARKVSRGAADNLTASEATAAKALELRNSAATACDDAELYARQTHLQLINKVAIKSPDVAAIMRGDNDLEIDVINKLRTGLLGQMANDDTSIADALTDFVKHFEYWRFQKGTLASYDQQLNRTSAATIDLRKTYEAAQKRAELASLINNEIDDAQRAQIENAIFEFEAVHSLLWGIVYKFSLQPSDFLVLILVIVMGILGSSLQLSYIYVNEFGSRNISFYILRPFLGVLTAFVVFIVTKAGVPLLTDTAKLGGNAPINPYFISFIAIISGLLSERALESLRRIGSGYFGSQDASEPDRWAFGGLRNYFDSIARDPHQLKIALDADDQKIDDWIDGKAAIPPSVQRLIAAVIDRPRHELFTDLGPA